ncbi:MAG: hypothetical protein V1806_07875 [Pseudomonadota bacterium]
MNGKTLMAGMCLWAALLLAPAAWAGMVLEGRCVACGYATGGLALFGGRADFQRNCRFPVLCPDCGRLEVVNLLDARAACRQCPASPMIPYDDPRLAGAPGGQEVASWRAPNLGRTLRLSNGGYYCPACGKFELRFKRLAMYD